MTPTMLGLLLWVSLGVVNVLVGRKKGIDTPGLIMFSVLAAPLVYLYVLACPAKPPST